MPTAPPERDPTRDPPARDGHARVLVIDDHDAMRRALVDLIEAHDSLSVCAAAASAEEAVDLVYGCTPDAVVVDVSLPGMNGIDLTRRLHRDTPDLPVIVVSSHPPNRFEQAALDAGARAYLMKRDAASHLVHALRHALSDGRNGNDGDDRPHR